MNVSPTETTGTIAAADRAELQRSVESLLGRVLFAYSKLEAGLDLCIVWVDEGKELDARTRKIEGLSFAQKLSLLADDVNRRGSRSSRDSYETWLTRAHKVRERRNILVHGRLGVDSNQKQLKVIASRATSPTLKSVELSLTDLNEIIDETGRLIHDLNSLRREFPL